MYSPVFLLLSLVLVAISGVHPHNTPAKPHHEVIEVIEVPAEVKPVHPPKPVHHEKPVVAVPVKHVVDVNALKQTVQRLWPLFCLIPKAYHIYKPLKVKCPKLLASSTAQMVAKIQAQLARVEVQPVAVEAVKVKVV